ncbi:hypothetical protein [Clostridium novyi]|uniref:hypothetical protein n=1 Tax=Clostridium novyi TaxID=1542 RepID=UPI00057D2897|nr:hypothetical protein [Clostridium novyi]
MDSGIDSRGKQVHYKDAVLGKSYFCPHCTEKLVLRRGQKSCFAHNVIKERTPLQRTCPEYHENINYSKIINNADIIHISNGGVPLYLCNDGNKFEIRAIFPQISDKFKNSLIENKTEVIIDNVRWCYVEDLNYYTVYNIKDWIHVKVNPSTNYQEVKRKWLWGIRGINIDKDIYYANLDGGYRLPIKANVYVGKTYRIMFNKNNPLIYGVTFNKIGEIQLKEFGRRIVLYIYDMKINKFTEEVKEFIEGKGYKLVKKHNKMIPVWPPAICKGNDLTFDNDIAWFFHKDNHNEYFYEIEAGIIGKIVENKVLKISNISKYAEKTIITTNRMFFNESVTNISAEIKYFLNYREKLNNKNALDPNILLKDIEGQIVEYNKDNDFISKHERLFIESNIPILATIKRGNYCLYSSKYNLENIDYGKVINIDCGAFGNITYRCEKKSKTKAISEKINCRIIYEVFYKCSGKYVEPTYKNKVFLYKLKKKISKENIYVYQILYKWIKSGNIPMDAQKILNEIEGKLND